MGTCVYWLRAEFGTPGALKKVFPAIKKFWKQGIEAEIWYQANREMATPKNVKDPHLHPDLAKKNVFWKTFEKKFPLVFKMTDRIHDAGHVNGKYLERVPVNTMDPNNALAGHIEFGYDADAVQRLEVAGKTLYFESEIWHMADWTMLCTFLKTEFGAKKTGFISEEDISMSEVAANAIEMK